MITIWQHGEDETAGEVGDYLTCIREPFETIRLFETRIVPKNLPSHLIILGGQMSVNDTRNFPFFSEEQQIIREMVANGKPVLGICLGAQMIAASFGERVYPSTPERGWCRITGFDPDWRAVFPEEFIVFHWHNETFNLPTGAIIIAKGDTVKNQVFKMGSAVGVQFHPEVTPQIISRWSGSLQKEEQNVIRSGTGNHLDQSRKRCRDLIDAFMKGWV
jgi:GMP synthase-like glutamine amidotransferase